MSLALLYPLALLGALAAAVPIWLHLRRRQETDLVRFSALQFLDDQPLPRRRPLLPRDWPLLLLRVAALLLLVAAFTWPYLTDTPEAPQIEESYVYILDNTMSNQADGAFQMARDGLVQEISAAGPQRQIAVVELTSVPRVLAGFADDHATAIERLRGLKPSLQRGSYLAAFRTADSLLRQSFGAGKHIVLAGDSQENQWSEAGQVLPFMDDAEITLPQVDRPNRANTALVQPSVQRLFVDDRVLAECSVRLLHQGDRKTITVVFRAGDKEMARREVKLSGPAESTTVTAQWETDPTKWLAGEVRLEGHTDALAADDRVVLALAPVREGRVALLARSLYLRASLSPEVMKGRWATRVLSPADLESAQTPEEDVLCLESHFLQAASARTLVKSFMSSGRGVVLAIDQASPVIAGFLRDLGIEVASEASLAANEARIRYIATEHPVFQPFRAADFGNLTQIEVWRHRRVAVSTAVPLVFSAEGDPLVIESDAGKSKLLVLAFAIDKSETNWPIHPSFIPFLDRCLEHARSQAGVQTLFEPGESIVWQATPSRQASQVGLRPLAGGAALASAPVVNGQARLNLPDAQGLYTIHYDGRPEVEAVVAVNPSPEESRLTYAASPDIAKAWMRRDTRNETAPEPAPETATSLTEQSKAEIFRQRIWWWLAIAGLVALVLETAWLSFHKGWA